MFSYFSEVVVYNIQNLSPVSNFFFSQDDRIWVPDLFKQKRLYSFPERFIVRYIFDIQINEVLSFCHT